MTERARTGRPSLVLLVILLSALAIGASASAIAGAGGSPPAPAGGGPSIAIPASWVAFSLLGAVAAGIGLLIYYRITSDVLPIPTRLVVVALAAILVGTLFVVVAHAVVVSGGIASTHGAPANGTAEKGVNETTNNSLNRTGPGGGFFLGIAFPPWTWFLAAVAIAIAVAIVASPPVRDLLFSRRGGGRRSTEATEEVRTALSGAVRDLEGGDDPRAVIRALYARLLSRLAPIVGDLEPATPEEIRSQHLVRLGIRPDAATALTRLFEEARYSTHPMDEASKARALAVIRAAEADLTRSAPAS